MNIVILAAGQGKRMHSTLPKVLHPVAGRPMLAHVLDAVRPLAPQHIIVVVGHGATAVMQAFAGQTDIAFAHQHQQLGTGHALQQAMPILDDKDITLMLYGDGPLIRTQTLRALLAAAGTTGFGLLTVTLPDPSGYGRIIRNTNGQVQRIVEQKDATSQERAITEVNTGILAAPTVHLKRWLAQLQNHNAQGEYYATDIIAMAASEGMVIHTVHPAASWETDGINDKAQLAAVERAYQRAQAHILLQQGVSLLDPNRFDVRGTLSCGADVSIDVNCVFEGAVTLADGVSIGPNCVIKDAQIGAATRIEAFTHIDNVRIGASAKVGPYARLRPGTVLSDETHIGNFVELKNTQMGQGSKANHLAYLGDAQVGAGVNYGAGSITANYDGANKHVTVIEDNVHVGSNCVLVAPVTVGQGATIGAGSTISKSVPAGGLTVARAKQSAVPGWIRPVKLKK
jgi:bifunctional UDP-N-acetylglucosamine pyrophosphorylase/glucosamine-1-phosphate N-acetyltransferase